MGIRRSSVFSTIQIYISCKDLHTQIKSPKYQYVLECMDPNNNLGIQKILSSCHTHQISMFAWFCNFDTPHVGSLTPYPSSLLILCIHLYTGSNIGKRIQLYHAYRCSITKYDHVRSTHLSWSSLIFCILWVGWVTAIRLEVQVYCNFSGRMVDSRIH